MIPILRSCNGRVRSLGMAPYAWAQNPRSSFLKAKIASRAVTLLITPLATTVANATTTVFGVGYGLCAIVTVGKSKAFNHKVNCCLTRSNNLISGVYISLLRTINPTAPLPCSHRDHPSYQPDVLVDQEGNGLLSGKLCDILDDYAHECANSKSCWKQHVVSRFVYFLSIPLIVIARVVDFAIGLIAVVFSFLTLGTFGSINNVAFRGLQITGIVSDLFYGLIKTINPWADFSLKRSSTCLDPEFNR